MSCTICCNNSANNTKQAILRFERKELLADIKNYAYIEWDTMKRDNDHDRHMVADIVEKGNVERVTRVLDLTFAHIVELCYPYTKKWAKPKSSRDDEYEEEDEYVMYMTIPETFSETTLNYLEKLIHNLLVNAVLADWFSMTKPESAANWATKTNALEDAIVTSLTHRYRPLTRKSSPY